jgi:hypothetical protein
MKIAFTNRDKVTVDQIRFVAPYRSESHASFKYPYRLVAPGQYFHGRSYEQKMDGLNRFYEMKLWHTASNGTLLVEGPACGVIWGQDLFGYAHPKLVANKMLRMASERLHLAESDEHASSWRTGEVELNYVSLSVHLDLGDRQTCLNLVSHFARQMGGRPGKTETAGEDFAFHCPDRGRTYGISIGATGAMMAKQRVHMREDAVFARLSARSQGKASLKIHIFRRELMRHGLDKLSNWTAVTGKEIFNEYLDRVPFLDVIPAPADWLGDQFTSAERRALGLLSLGRDMRIFYTEGSWLKVKNRLRAKGIDPMSPYELNANLSPPKLLSEATIARAEQWLIDAERAPPRRRAQIAAAA